MSKMSKKNKCIVNQKTNKCILSDMENETSNKCYLGKRTRKCHNYPAEFDDTTTLARFTLTQKAKEYLDKKILNKTSAQIAKLRKIHNDKDLFIPVDDYTTDSALKDYLVGEVLTLANHYARDSDGPDIICIKGIKNVIKEDYDLNILLK